MAASYSDKQFLAADPTFILRVQEALAAACIAIVSEADSTAYHYARLRYAVQVMQGIIGSIPSNYAKAFAIAAATDANCISDATGGGTVVLTAGNTPAQAALVTDAHIDTAISSQFNSFFNKAQ